MKKVYSFLLVATLLIMPLIVSGCNKSDSMHFKTTYVQWINSEGELHCTYGMSIDNDTVATYFNKENFKVILWQDNRGSGSKVNYISEEGSLVKNDFIYILPQSTNNLLKIGFSVDESWLHGKITIMCFDKVIYTGKVGVAE